MRLFQGPGGVKVSSLSPGFLVYFKKTESFVNLIAIACDFFLRLNVKMSDATKVSENTE